MSQIKDYTNFAADTLKDISNNGIKGKKEIDELFTQYEKTYSNQLDKFYCYSFLLYYHYPGIFRASEFKKSYLKLKNVQDISILFEYFQRNKIKFFRFCKKMEDVPFFILRPEIKEFVLKFFTDTFKIPKKPQLLNEINIIDFILQYNTDIDLKSHTATLTIPRSFYGQFWQLHHNPYIDFDNIQANIAIYNEQFTTSVRNVMTWLQMSNGVEILIRKQRRLYAIGGDTKSYTDINDFLKSFNNNEFVTAHVDNFLLKKIDKASANKATWQEVLAIYRKQCLDQKLKTKGREQNLRKI